MRILVLSENTVYKRGLLAEHGLSLLIEHGGKRVLFDTGQSSIYLQNASVMGVSLEGLDAVVLSHGHYDHTGGFPFLPEEKAPVYAGEGAFDGKFHKDRAGGMSSIGIPWEKGLVAEGRLHTVKEKKEILPGWFLLPRVPYQTAFEEKNSCFLTAGGTDAAGGCPEDCEPDRLEDEQVLAVRTEKGLCLFMGCCHPGVINCILHVKEQLPGEPVHAVLAGMHLSDAPEERVDQTVRAFRELEFNCLIPVHCTGLVPIAKLKMALGDRCLIASCGSSILI